MNYFVLGSNSFAGATFINELLSCEEEVVGVSRSETPSDVLKPYTNNPFVKNFHFYRCDLNQHADIIQDLISHYKPKYIIDFASQSMVAESWKNPDHWYQTNIVAKARLHSFLRNAHFLERYVRISTPEIYGHVDGEIKETDSFNPTTPYAISQATTDMSLAAFHKQYDFPVLFTRYANFYGPYQQLYRIIPKTIICCLLKKKFPLHGKGLSKRAFIYGTDVASAIIATIQKGAIGESYHFSTGDCLSIAELIEKICHLMGVSFEEIVEMAEERPGKDLQYFMSTQKAREKLAWQPSTSLETGIQNTIEWAKCNIQHIKAMPLDYVHQA